MNVTTELVDATAVIRYNNPPKAFLTLEGTDALLEAFTEAAAVNWKKLSADDQARHDEG